MKRTKLENWIETIEGLPELTREDLENLQLRRLNETLAKLKARGGFYKDYPEKLGSLSDLQTLPFTTAADLAARPDKSVGSEPGDLRCYLRYHGTCQTGVLHSR